jgi:superfamily II DNA or RNA helicase
MTVDWNDVARRARELLDGDKLDDGQADTLAWIADRLREAPGVVLADEVGTGKTRIACALIRAVVAAGGRVATVVPKGLMHQWLAEAKQLDDGLAAKAMTTLPELFRHALDEEWNALAPSPATPEWLLLSHNFRVPQVRANSHTWRAALPALVELLLAPKAVRQDRRTREGRLDEYMSLNVDTKHTTKRWSTWDGIEHIAKDVTEHATKEQLRELRTKLKRLPDLKITKRDGRIDCDVNVEAFRAANGEGVSEEILGLWLGTFDLVVIDEAHKSRGVVEDDDELTEERTGKVLARLLGKVIRPSATVRRLCLTATPMELDLHQWLDLLARAGCQPKDAESIVERLRCATRDAATAPDELARLATLRDAAVEFTRALRPFVTRRRRTEDALVQQVRALGGGNGPHPHRNVHPVRIEWSDPMVRANSWLDVLFAAECMSHAARGLTRNDTASWPAAIRDAYTKLCRGHVSADIDDQNVSIDIPADDETDAVTLGKIERVDYWYQQLRSAHARAGAATRNNGLAESEHPRITLAVGEIERWTDQGEKVLVFGVFLAPLRVLRNVLNVRSTLRALDAGRPIAHAIDQNKELMTIAMRQVVRMRDDGLLGGQLADVTQRGDLETALRRGKKTYSDLQNDLRRTIDKTIAQWVNDPRRLRGVEDKKVLSNLRSHTMAFVLDEFLTTNDHGNERIALLAETYFDRHVVPELEDAGEEDAADERLVTLRTLFDDDEDTRQRRFAVLLAGDTQPSTRRYIQAAFNRPSSSPRVLIAQSQVGREGLNLHEACRVVVQFHAEWNPAVLEQQIGRVDRKNSRWEQLAKEWLEHPDGKPLPRIEVRQLVFEGTYDAYQWERVARRQVMFDASLFGSLLPAEAWARVPADQRATLEAVAPNFRPPRR